MRRGREQEIDRLSRGHSLKSERIAAHLKHDATKSFLLETRRRQGWKIFFSHAAGSMDCRLPLFDLRPRGGMPAKRAKARRSSRRAFHSSISRPVSRVL